MKGKVEKFLDVPDSRMKRSGAALRKGFPIACFSGCYPVACGFNDGTRGGWCTGLIWNANDLDCIRLCVNTAGTKGREDVTVDLHMTPTEAIEIGSFLLTAAQAALQHNSEYKAHHDHMVRMRENGDFGQHGELPPEDNGQQEE